MPLFVFLLLLCVYIRTSICGSLKVVEYAGECFIWSDNNRGCTGSSESIGLRTGDDCSHLSKIIGGTRTELSVLNVNTCGKVDDKQLAWIQVNKTGLLTFSNRNGDRAECNLKDGFKLGNSCSASDFVTSTQASTTVVTSTQSSTTVVTPTQASTTVPPKPLLPMTPMYSNSVAVSSCGCL